MNWLHGVIDAQGAHGQREADQDEGPSNIEVQHEQHGGTWRDRCGGGNCYHATNGLSCPRDPWAEMLKAAS